MAWQPGKSGNPAGNPAGSLPKAKPWRNALERAIKRQHDLTMNGEEGPVLPQFPIDGEVVKGKVVVTVPEGQALDVIADMCVQQALCGDVSARREISDRLDGKVPTPIEGTDVPLIHTVRWYGEDDDEDDKPEEPK